MAFERDAATLPDLAAIEAMLGAPGELVENTPASLRRYLRRLGLLETDDVAARRQMAIAISALPVIERPAGFLVACIDPADQRQADTFVATAGRSLRPSYVAEHFARSESDDGRTRYFLGIVDAGEHATAICTMQVTDPGGHREVVAVDIVTTGRDWRHHGYAAAMLSTVLHDYYGDVPVAVLGTTRDADGFYRHLGFVHVGEAPSGASETADD